MLFNEERPYRFDQLVGQKEIVRNLKAQSKTDNFGQFYLFYGQYGSGKTTCAEILKRAVNCTDKDEEGNPCLVCENCRAIMERKTTDIIDIDGASNNGVDNVRTLQENLAYGPVQLKKKVIVIDEVHMLSTGAFNALLKTLEEPPDYAIFIFCTTEVNKIPYTIRSRAYKYCFEQISSADMEEHLKKIAVKHNMIADEKACALIARTSQGSMRDALGLLEQASSFAESVTEECVAKILGITDTSHIFVLLKALLSNDTGKALAKISELTRLGKNLFLLSNDLLDVCADAVLSLCSGMDEVANTEVYKEMLSALIKEFALESFCTVMDHILDIRNELRSMPSKNTFVCGVIKMTTSSQNALMQRLRQLEDRINENPNPTDLQEIRISKDSSHEEDEIWPAAQKEEEEETVPKFQEVNTGETQIDRNTENKAKEMDAFELLDMFCFSKTDDKSERKVMNTNRRPKEEKKESKMQKEYEKDKEKLYTEYLEPLYAKEPILESILDLCCVLEEGEKGIVFQTKFENLYRILKVYDGRYSFPFYFELIKEDIYNGY